ncbi:MAG: integrase core domain-containing protein [Microgenomates group bacterium]
MAQKRLEIIQFFNKHGEMATKEAFGADRRVISRWQQRLTKSKGRLSSLIPISTKPHTLRTPKTDCRIVEFIRKQREDHPRTGKEKIALDLDEYCQGLSIKSVSSSTIGNIIKRHRFFFQKAGKAYHNPASKWAQNQAKKKKRLRIKHSPKPKKYGHILSDTVERITDGVRDYFISAIDAKMKFALTLNYSRLTAVNMKDFYGRFKEVYPGKTRIWQSDNGGENLSIFDQQLEKDGIPHLFIYPRCPKIDTFIERYNRTLQEEFIDENLDTIHDKKTFFRKLADWNIYYNTKRRHHSLGLKSPLQSLIEKGGMSHKCLTYTAFGGVRELV